MQDAHIDKRLRALQGAMLDIACAMDRAQRDAAEEEAAGFTLDRTLYPLLAAIGRRGPIGVVELAERAGRDYTTVSRQVTKLERLGLVARKEKADDLRVHGVVATRAGKAAARRVETARGSGAAAVLERWSAEEIEVLAHLLKKLAKGLSDTSKTEPTAPRAS